MTGKRELRATGNYSCGTKVTGLGGAPQYRTRARCSLGRARTRSRCRRESPDSGRARTGTEASLDQARGSQSSRRIINSCELIITLSTNLAKNSAGSHLLDKRQARHFSILEQPADHGARLAAETSVTRPSFCKSRTSSQLNVYRGNALVLGLLIIVRRSSPRHASIHSCGKRRAKNGKPIFRFPSE